MGKVSLTSRMAIVFMLVVTVVLTAAAISFNYFCRLHFERKDAQVLNEKAEAVERTLRSSPAFEQKTASRIDAVIEHSFGFATAVVVDGRTVYSHHNLSESLLPLAKGIQDERWTVDYGGHQYSGITRKVNQWVGGQDTVVYLALDVTHRIHFFEMIQQWFAYTLVVSALLSGALGVILIKKGLKPIDELSKTSSTVTANCLDTRIPTESVPGELHELVDNFNEMLSRLDDSFLRLSGFSADIAHELRTPLNSMLTQMEVALLRDRENADYKDIIYSALEELRRMSKMVDDMLFLAKADNGKIIPSTEDASMAEITASVVEYYDLAAEDRNVRIELTGDGQVKGDKSMLRRAISNIVSNAVRYADEGSTISVEIWKSGTSISTAISNRGITIPEELQTRVFDRFYRVDTARREGTTLNAGLGMAITRSIVEAHKGRIACVSADGFTTFTLTLPVRDESRA
ncbi:heavy metal sensor histidine kinase [Stutzerimonas kunmingensis]|uniref:Sensor protein n=1 Tax=Stutzerimonas kunmingensis TaxID=1211807 RepID=A0A9X1N906_9GAMM|nr:heavy metal sensor histidine kinase [Stutzerimonas kunmingensis]MBU2282504.1 heavy metal sensor histidine kinase [Gammaproteobacteria bacterium]MCD1610171.1 heavy metal sensor histidine kinase [Stutzerimonas kunmingensis]CEG54413.1 Heavy metal sensor signal transduction histidine kinase [Stutzerimonas xanthomarina]